MTAPSSTGAAVTSHTRWPASRCRRASAWVPDQIRSAISSSKISSLSWRSSSHRATLDEGQRRLPRLGHVTAVLAGQQPEPELAHAEPDQVAGGEVLAGGEAAGEVVDRRALHHRVVDVEEAGRAGVQRSARARPRVRRRRTPAARSAIACAQPRAPHLPPGRGPLAGPLQEGIGRPPVPGLDEHCLFASAVRSVIVAVVRARGGSARLLGRSRRVRDHHATALEGLLQVAGALLDLAEQLQPSAAARPRRPGPDPRAP